MGYIDRFFSWLDDQNSKKIRTPFLSVSLLVFMALHPKIFLYLLPFGFDPKVRSDELDAAISVLRNDWLTQLWTVIWVTFVCILGYYVISIIQKSVILVFENLVYPFIQVRLEKREHTNEEYRKLQESLETQVKMVEDGKERIVNLSGSNSHLQKELSKVLQDSERRDEEIESIHKDYRGKLVNILGFITSTFFYLYKANNKDGNPTGRLKEVIESVEESIHRNDQNLHILLDDSLRGDIYIDVASIEHALERRYIDSHELVISRESRKMTIPANKVSVTELGRCWILYYQFKTSDVSRLMNMNYSDIAVTLGD